MATLIVKKDGFAKALYELAQLSFDTIYAYQAAIDKSEETEYKIKLIEFMDEHKRRAREICELLNNKSRETLIN